MSSLRSRYHSPGLSSSSNALSTAVGCSVMDLRPTRLKVRPEPSVRMTRWVELFQHGWAIFTTVGLIEATGQRGAVHRPRPPRYTNSMLVGLRQLSIGLVVAVVYPVEVCFNAMGRLPVARTARLPLT